MPSKKTHRRDAFSDRAMRAILAALAPYLPKTIRDEEDLLHAARAVHCLQSDNSDYRKALQEFADLDEKLRIALERVGASSDGTLSTLTDADIESISEAHKKQMADNEKAAGVMAELISGSTRLLAESQKAKEQVSYLERLLREEQRRHAQTKARLTFAQMEMDNYAQTAGYWKKCTETAMLSDVAPTTNPTEAEK